MLKDARTSIYFGCQPVRLSSSGETLLVALPPAWLGEMRPATAPAGGPSRGSATALSVQGKPLKAKVPCVLVAWDEQMFSELELYYLDLLEVEFQAFGKNRATWCDPASLIELADLLGYAEGADEWATGAEGDDEDALDADLTPPSLARTPPRPRKTPAGKKASVKPPAKDSLSGEQRLTQPENKMDVLLREIRGLVQTSGQSSAQPKANPQRSALKGQGTGPVSSAGAGAGGLDPGEVERARAVLKRPEALSFSKAFKTGQPATGVAGRGGEDAPPTGGLGALPGRTSAYKEPLPRADGLDEEEDLDVDTTTGFAAMIREL